MTTDLTEIWVALRTALLADAGLVALLANNASIYRGEPMAKIAYPSITLHVPNDGPQLEYDGTGIWRPDLALAIYAVAHDTCEAIKAYLDANWTIPVNRPARVASANLRLTNLRRSAQSGPTPVRTVDTSENLYALTTFWSCRVNRTN